MKFIMIYLRKKVSWRFSVVACLLAATAGFVVAQVSENSKTPVREGQEAFDVDGDGFLNATERLTMIQKTIEEADLNLEERRDAPSFGPPPGGFGPGAPGGPGSGRGPGGEKSRLVEKHDLDGDGKLNAEERATARTEAKASGEGRGGRGGRGRFGGPGRGVVLRTPQAGRPFSPDQVEHYPEADFYDPTVIRTIFLTFENQDWESELKDFYRTDVEVPAKLNVDGKEYATVGVRFRGNTSSSRVPEGFKKSLNISIDYEKGKQRLYGYKTLNLLNAHTDASMMHEVLFSHIAKNYMPSLKANFVRVVINGESWGLYVNSQQFNKEFLEEAFDTRGGVRWKKAADPMRGGGLMYAGEQIAAYEGQYQMKTDLEDPSLAWNDLIDFTRTLAETPVENLEETLDPYLDIDGALWFLAMENVMIDNDGYWIRASDFNFYQDPNGRFHMVSHDNNETFKQPGGPGFPRGGNAAGLDLDPLFGMGAENKPLLRLLENPALRARYLAHVKTIAEDWLNWKKTGQVIDTYKNLIQEDVRLDTRHEETYEQFLASFTPGSGSDTQEEYPTLKTFLEERGDYLLSNEEVIRPTASIEWVQASGPVKDDNDLGRWELKTTIRAKVSDPENALSSLMLYATTDPMKPYERIEMQSIKEGDYQAVVDQLPPGEKLYYYVEARGIPNQTGSSYHPRTASYHPMTMDLFPSDAGETGLVISEVMASNTSTIQDPQGDHDDWIEIYNTTNARMDLSDFFLSDNPSRPLKWQFPKGTQIESGERRLIWADENGKASEGLHANFKLSAKGENIILAKRKDGDTTIIDFLAFDKLKQDESTGKQGRFATPSPGE